MSKRFLVTGGTGFLGAPLVRRLVQAGHQVRVLDNGFRSSKERLADLFDALEFIKGDIQDSAAVHRAIQGMDTVVHLAAVNGTEFFYSKPVLVLEVGIRGILNVLEGCLKANVGDLLVASSSEVYQTPSKIPTDETEPLVVPDVLNPRYSYGGSKIATELLTLNHGRSHFQRTLIFRPHNVYGPDMGEEHVLPQFIRRAVDALAKHPIGPLPFTIQGNGQQTRSFIHIDDMIDGIMLLIDKGQHLNIYHVGNPEEVTIAEVAKKVVQFLGREVDLHYSALQPGSTERRCPDIAKIKALGFSPKISLNDGLPSIIEWYIQHTKTNF